MTHSVSRRALGAALAVSISAGKAHPALVDDEGRDYPAPSFKPTFKKPQLGKILVQDFVIFAHGDLDMVKRLYEKEHALINATMDWGGGDFESAMGGASHMGRRDIAEFLLEKGARIDIFAAAMLGHLDVVKSFLAARPNLIDCKGPHGIPLMTHAEMGKEGAVGVLNYLKSIGTAAPNALSPQIK